MRTVTHKGGGKWTGTYLDLDSLAAVATVAAVAAAVTLPSTFAVDGNAMAFNG